MDMDSGMDWKLVVVVVPVADIDRAMRFYREQVGFRLDHDTRVNLAVRIVKLTPLVGLHLVVPDLDAARAHLVRQGGIGQPRLPHGRRRLEGGPRGRLERLRLLRRPGRQRMDGAGAADGVMGL